MSETGAKIYQLVSELFPICRSLTGEGVRKTLNILHREIPELEIFSIPSGTNCFDWTVPREWNINDAYIITPDGEKIANFKENNLHVVGYSIPVDQTISLEELQTHLYSLEEQPDAIPYITSYYKERWGFCLAQIQRDQLKEGEYKVYIDSELKEGVLNYGEVILPGSTTDEILLSTYICHPSMANNELSGPAVTTFLIKWLKQLKNRRFTYRIVFIPETIGSIVYLSRYINHLKKHVVAGFNITCIGDNREYSYLPSRNGETISDQVAKHVLEHKVKDYVAYSYLERGSDERQYCSPGVDLPIVSIMRSKYATYPEYHTSLDNLSFVSPEGLKGGYNILKLCLEALENNFIYKSDILCEPQLGKRGLYPTLSTKNMDGQVRNMMNFLAFCDGKNDLLTIADIINAPIWDLYSIAQQLEGKDVISKR